MSNSRMENGLIVFFRIAMAWTFLYAATHQAFDPNWNVAGFLKSTKTFHDIYAPLAAPPWEPIITFLVKYGHLLIGLSLLMGLMVRVSAAFGVLLMVLYWTAHMDFPYIENRNNFLLDYHIVYAGVLTHLIITRAGHLFGLDDWASRLPFIAHRPALKTLFS